MEEQEDKKVVLNEADFKILERQAMNSIDRMTNNSFINFMLVSMFRNSTDVQKNDMIELLKSLRKDITEVHKAKAEFSFKLTEEQSTIYMTTVDEVVTSSFKHIEKEISLFKKVVDNKL